MLGIDDKLWLALLAPLAFSVIALLWIVLLVRSGRPLKLAIAGLGVSVQLETKEVQNGPAEKLPGG